MNSLRWFELGLASGTVMMCGLLWLNGPVFLGGAAAAIVCGILGYRAMDRE